MSGTMVIGAGIGLLVLAVLLWIVSFIYKRTVYKKTKKMLLDEYE